MFCKEYTRAGTHENGKPLVIADLITKSISGTKPATTEGIDNISGDMVLAPGSTLMSTNPLGFYVLNDEFTWDQIGEA